MILTNHGILSSSGGVLDDAQAFIAAANITDNTQKSAITTLVTDLKTYNIWDKMKAVYPFVGSTASSHKFNLKDPRDLDAAYRLVFNGGWTHSNTGALPNGTNAYADTKLVPSVIAQNSVHTSVYLRTDIDGAYFDIYAENASSGLGFLAKYSTRKWVYMNTLSSDNAIDFTASTGLYIGNRTSSISNVLFRNTSKLVNGNRASLTPNSTHSIYLGAGNFTGVLGNYSPREQAFASIGDGLTDAEVTAFYNAVQAYQTTLGRQV